MIDSVKELDKVIAGLKVLKRSFEIKQALNPRQPKLASIANLDKAIAGLTELKGYKVKEANEKITRG